MVALTIGLNATSNDFLSLPETKVILERLPLGNSIIEGPFFVRHVVFLSRCQILNRQTFGQREI